MKKVFLYTALLLILAVVLTTPAVAAKGRPGPPERGEEKVVKFTGDISISIEGSAVTMMFHKKGRNIRCYDEYDPDNYPGTLYFPTKFEEVDFSGEHPFWGILISMKEGEPPEATTWIGFGELDLVDEKCERYIAPFQLRGFGMFELTTDGTYETYEITLTDTAIYDVEYVPSRSKGCKGAWGKEYVNPRQLTEEIVFDMEIQ